MAIITGSISATSNLSQSITATPGGSVVTTSQNVGWAVTSGTGSDRSDAKYLKPISLVAGVPQALDLSTLPDGIGAACDFARIKSILVVNDSVTDPITVGYATTTTNAWTGLFSNPGTIVIQPSTSAGNMGFLLACAPSATGWVVDSTHKLIQFSCAANAEIRVEFTGCTV
jgi:hypothetical protein